MWVRSRIDHPGRKAGENPGACGLIENCRMASVSGGRNLRLGRSRLHRPGGQLGNSRRTGARRPPVRARLSGSRAASWTSGAATSLLGRRLVLVFVEPSEDRARSEEHTSELQSLMSISDAVFCLLRKQKKITYNRNYSRNTEI